MAFSFKFPAMGGDSGAAEGGSSPAPATSVLRPAALQRIKTLGACFVALLLATGGLVYHDIREAGEHTAAISAVGEMRVLAQRIVLAAAGARNGEAVALGQLKVGRDQYAQGLERLNAGGLPLGEALTQRWQAVDETIKQILAQEKRLLAFGQAMQASKPADLALLGEQLLASRLQAGGTAREVAVYGQVLLLAQRMRAETLALMAGAEVDAARLERLRQDNEVFRSLLLNSRAMADAEARSRLLTLETAFQNYSVLLEGGPANLAAINAVSRLPREGELLVQATEALAQGMAADGSGQALRTSLAVGMSLLALVCLGWLVRVYREDSEQRARAAELQQQASEQANRENQDAILRLMNELGDLADGDLTVNATVSESITGAIADSINYTVEELRVLVGRINDAAERVTAATEIARRTSDELIAATTRQATEIQQAGDSARHMAQSMSQVSGQALQSAQVARQSLSAAEKGTQAVEDSIRGMNDIRYQIQETSKRIKRLGESSQEISEIVDLISDITEQTNVLALNAAIQAASAGEAGRGFSVVAEEVQRLAERSGEATKQIAALVKTIQTDTQDAVVAMEQSTRGVVAGAQLSDAAGQALSEIGAVSRSLAELIQEISASTQQQADSATGVASLMQGILQVTEQATAGTERTAQAVEALATLATELKGSVAGFKVD